MNEKPKILVADDEQECLDFVLDALADTPCELITATDGEQALQLAKQHQPQLVILDVQMPKLDGYAVFGELRKDAATAARAVAAYLWVRASILRPPNSSEIT